MKKIKVKKSFSSPVPFIVALILSVGLGFLVAILGSPGISLYVTLITFPILYGVVHYGMASDMDETHEEGTRIAIENAKASGAKSITIIRKENTRDRGALVGLPQKRIYRVKF
jgi:hypothetical protein